MLSLCADGVETFGGLRGGEDAIKKFALVTVKSSERSGLVFVARSVNVGIAGASFVWTVASLSVTAASLLGFKRSSQYSA